MAWKKSDRLNENDRIVALLDFESRLRKGAESREDKKLAPQGEGKKWEKRRKRLKWQGEISPFAGRHSIKCRGERGKKKKTCEVEKGGAIRVANVEKTLLRAKG